MSDLTTNTWRFACASDLHYTYDVNGNLSWNGGDHGVLYSRLKRDYDIDFVLCTGDLTQNGNDGNGWLCTPYNELQAFIDRYVSVVEGVGVPVKVCHGNHDVNRGSFPFIGILKYIRDRHNATYSFFNTDIAGCYSFDHKGVKFICMGDVPRNLEWLQKTLPTEAVAPVILFQHQSPDPNNFDFWTQTQRDEFYRLVSHHNIKLLCTGHSHAPHFWAWRGIPMLISFSPVVVTVNEVADVAVNLYP